MPPIKTLRSIPSSVAVRTARTLTRRFEQIEEAGRLGEVHPYDLATVRMTVDLCELILDRNPSDVAQWKTEEGKLIYGLPVHMYKSILDMELYASKDLKFDYQLILTGNRIVYVEVWREVLGRCKIDLDNRNKIISLIQKLQKGIEVFLISFAGRTDVQASSDARELVIQTFNYLSEMETMTTKMLMEKAPNDVLGIHAARVYHVHEVLETRQDLIAKPDPGLPPALLEFSWWLEESEISEDDNNRLPK